LTCRNPAVPTIVPETVLLRRTQSAPCLRSRRRIGEQM
jgi:hypothetical protein